MAGCTTLIGDFAGTPPPVWMHKPGANNHFILLAPSSLRTALDVGSPYTSHSVRLARIREVTSARAPAIFVEVPSVSSVDLEEFDVYEGENFVPVNSRPFPPPMMFCGRTAGCRWSSGRPAVLPR